MNERFSVVVCNDGDIDTNAELFPSLDDATKAIEEAHVGLLEMDGFRLTELEGNGEDKWYCAIVYFEVDDEIGTEQVSFCITMHTT